MRKRAVLLCRSIIKPGPLDSSLHTIPAAATATTTAAAIRLSANSSTASSARSRVQPSAHQEVDSEVGTSKTTLLRDIEGNGNLHLT